MRWAVRSEKTGAFSGAKNTLETMNCIVTALFQKNAVPGFFRVPGLFVRVPMVFQGLRGVPMVFGTRVFQNLNDTLDATLELQCPTRGRTNDVRWRHMHHPTELYRNMIGFRIFLITHLRPYFFA